MKTKYLLITMMFTASLFAQEKQPFGWWKMDAISSEGLISDISGNGLDMEVGEGCSVVRNPLLGNVIRWDGSSAAWGRFRAPALKDRTISLWLYRDRFDSDVDSQNNNKIPYVFRYFSNMQLNFNKNTEGMICAFGNWNASPYIFLSPSREMWHQVTLTFHETAYDEQTKCSTGVLCSYLDGCLMQKQTDYQSQSAISIAQDTIIGNVSTDPNALDPRPFSGSFSQIRVYDSALSAGEVHDLYRDDVDRLGITLIGAWKMDAFKRSENNQRYFPARANSTVELTCGEALRLVSDGLGGSATEFPNDTGAWATFQLPISTPALSFSLWVNVATNLLELETDTPKNPVPHLMSMERYTRIAVDGSYRNNDKAGAHFFDVRSYDDPNDQGFYAPSITVQKGQWSHLGLTYEMSPAANGQFAVTPRIYVDGHCVCTGRVQAASKLTGFFQGESQIVVGNMNVGGPRAFGGKLSDFASFSGILSEEQMAELAKGMPRISAGADQIVAVGTPVYLSGEISLTGRFDNRSAMAVEPKWTLVSAPAGGEAASIQTPGAQETVVSLPVKGSYVFRFTVQSPTLKLTDSDEMTVTCVNPQEKNVPPLVEISGEGTAKTAHPVRLHAGISDPDAGPGTLQVQWKLLSGPGAVSFEPSTGPETEALFYGAGLFRITALVSDGQAFSESEPLEIMVSESGEICLDRGMIGYWPFDVNQKEVIRQTSYDINRKSVRFESGVSEYGVRIYGFAYPYLDTRTTLLEVEESPGSTIPADRYRAFSLWMYHDPNDTNRSSHATLLDVPYTLGLWYNCEEGKNGFSLYQQTMKSEISGMGNIDEYGRPPVNPEGRWTHVYALFDRTTHYLSNTSELWIDGVKMENRIRHGMGGGRVHKNTIQIGGHSKNGEGANGHFKDEDGNILSKTFPGIIDEVRMYNRKLSESEIRFLATRPVVDINRKPAVRILSQACPHAAQGRNVDLVAEWGDDGYPKNRGLSGHWEVISGNADALSFANRNQRETTVTAGQIGVYRLSFVVTDGEKSVWSEPIILTVDHQGTVIRIE